MQDQNGPKSDEYALVRFERSTRTISSCKKEKPRTATAGDPPTSPRSGLFRFFHVASRDHPGPAGAQLKLPAKTRKGK
jgi:hypothetical protein